MSERNTKSQTNSSSSRSDSRAGQFVYSRSPLNNTLYSTPYSPSFFGYTGGLFTYGRAYRS